MTMLKTTSHLLVIAVASAVLAACGSGGSQSSGTPITANNQTDQGDDKVNAADLPAIDITPENAQLVAGSALKSMLLSDISANAIDSAVTITRDQNAELADMATGIVITMQPMACLYEGSFTIQASLESTGDDIQIDFADNLNLSFDTTFDQCNQGMGNIDGSLSIDFTAVVNELLAYNNFDLDTQVSIDQLTIQQTGYYPFVINGDLNYHVSSPDGVNVVTEVSATDMYYAADNSYQVLEYETYKSVYLPTGEYEYTIYTKYVDQMIENSLIEYQTIEPLRGVGFSVPASGKLLVFGGSDSMEINVVNTESIELVIDYGNDGVVDDIMYTTWNDLALSSLTSY